MLLGGSFSRWLTHGIMLALTLVACVVTTLLKPNYPLDRAVTVGTGYAALLMLVLTLVLGTWNQYRRRIGRNPVNLYSRRDVGIWVGFAGIVHVITGLRVHLGGQIEYYFFNEQGGIRTDLFGVSNYTGLIGTLILLALLVISNDLSMRLLKGKRWKTLQRFNYGLFAFVIAHTFLYQTVVRRESIMTYIVIILTILVVVVQAIGIFWYRSRARRAA